jgi:prepilin-type N-terminal cleavage/methylation domain-containing protein
MMRRRGLSLIEVLIAVVLLGIVGVGITRLLQSQMQFFGRSTNARDARAVTRNALNIVSAEMRMIEPRGIVAASADSFMVRIPYATGLHCNNGTATFAPVDSLVWAQAVYGGYAYRDLTVGAVTTYVAAGGASLATALATVCTGVSMTVVPSGRVLTVAPALPITTRGAPILLYQTITYRIAASTLVSGRTALWRRVAGGTNEEVAVPFGTGTRFRFYVSGGMTPQDAVPGTLNTMTGVELVLVGESERSSSGTGAVERDTLRVPILFRNAVQ